MTFKTDLDYNYQLSLKLREQSKVFIPEPSSYLESINQSMNDLNNSLNFFKEILDDPVRLFTDVQEQWQSTNTMFFKSIGHQNRKGVTGSLHEFQGLLASQMDSYFQEWLAERNLNIPAAIEVRNPSSFPSSYAICVDFKIIIIFDIFSKKYSLARNIKLDDDYFTKQIQSNKDSFKEKLSYEEKLLSKSRNLREHPIKNGVGVKHFFEIIFNRKQFLDRIDNDIKIGISRVDQLKKDQAYNTEMIHHQIEENDRSRCFARRFMPFLDQFDYSYEESHSKFY